MTFKEGVKSWMRNYDATYDEAVALEKMYRDSDKEPSGARTQDLYDALINYPHETEKSVQEDERGFDQTAKADKGKIRPTLVPRQIIRDIAVVREYGNRKYHDPDNWKEVEVERYRDALCRHLLAYLDDPKSVDEESGIPHYKHMATNMAFICEMESWDGEKCKNCRWWYRKKLKQEGHICACDTSDSFGEFTDENLSCNKWLPQLEQDGDATWFME